MMDGWIRCIDLCKLRKQMLVIKPLVCYYSVDKNSDRMVHAVRIGVRGCKLRWYAFMQT